MTYIDRTPHSPSVRGRNLDFSEVSTKNFEVLTLNLAIFTDWPKTSNLVLWNGCTMGHETLGI